MTLSELRSTIDRASIAYYRTGTAIMPDAQYDALIRELRNLDPGDERLTRVGPSYDASDIGNKATHKIPMGSLDNIDGGITGIPDWYDYIYQKLKLDNGIMDVMMSLKIDGSSIALYYENSRFVKAITRGNGTVGEDVTANAAMFQGVPTVLPIPGITCSVRGEAVLHKSDFDRITAGTPIEELGNPRNEGNGIVGRHDGTQSELIRVYAFNLMEDYTAAEFQQAMRLGLDCADMITQDGRVVTLTEEYKLNRLAELGFTVVPHRLANSVADMEEFYHNALANRVGLDYHIDGLVCVLNDVKQQNKFVTADPKSQLRPKHSRAIKFPAYFATTTVTGVVVTVGHNRMIVPTLAVAPVRIGAGITVDSVIVTNYDEVKRQGIEVGSTVRIFLAGDIVPNCECVIPTYACPECGFVGTEEEQVKHH